MTRKLKGSDTISHPKAVESSEAPPKELPRESDQAGTLVDTYA